MSWNKDDTHHEWVLKRYIEQMENERRKQGQQEKQKESPRQKELEITFL